MESPIEKIDLSHTEVQDYDPKWKELYEDEARKIRDLLGDKITSIEHIGSTSIPGLASKPIIDMAITIPSWKDAQDLIEPLSTIGYPSDAAQIDETNAGERWFFKKRQSDPISPFDRLWRQRKFFGAANFVQRLSKSAR